MFSFLVLALFAGKWAPRAFSRALLGTIGYCVLGACALQSLARMEWKDSLKAEGTTDAAAKGLLALTACLNQFRFHNPGSDYPSALESISSASSCDTKLAIEDALRGYTLQYIPLHAEPAKATVTGFELLATPRGRKRPGLEPLLSDDTGSFFQLHGWSLAGQQPQLQAIFVHCPLPSLGVAIKDFAKQHPNHPMPLDFDDLVAGFPLTGSRDLWLPGNKIQVGLFLTRVFSSRQP